MNQHVDEQQPLTSFERQSLALQAFILQALNLQLRQSTESQGDEWQESVRNHLILSCDVFGSTSRLTGDDVPSREEQNEVDPIDSSHAP
jgi:hypothetical protein